MTSDNISLLLDQAQDKLQQLLILPFQSDILTQYDDCLSFIEQVHFDYVLNASHSPSSRHHFTLLQTRLTPLLTFILSRVSKMQDSMQDSMDSGVSDMLDRLSELISLFSTCNGMKPKFTKYYHYPHHSLDISIQESTFEQANVGFKTWNSAIVFTRQVVSSHVYFRMLDASCSWIDIQNKRVLELGCGTGLVGIACAKMGARDVVLSDHLDSLLTITQLNIHQNQVEARASTLLLDWHHLPPHPPLFDCIVATDVCYDAECAHLLPTVLNHVLSVKNVAYIVNQSRGDLFTKEQDVFLSGIQREQLVIVHQSIVTQDVDMDTPFHFYVIKKT